MELMWLNRNAVILNTTLQVLDIYIYINIYIYIYKSKIIRSINNNRSLPFYSSSQVMIIPNTSHITLFLEKKLKEKS